MIVTIFIDHVGKIPKIAEVTGFSEDVFLREFNKAQDKNHYCRIKLDVSEETAKEIERLRR